MAMADFLSLGFDSAKITGQPLRMLGPSLHLPNKSHIC
jgi:hypothetical protein